MVATYLGRKRGFRRLGGILLSNAFEKQLDLKGNWEKIDGFFLPILL